MGLFEDLERDVKRARADAKFWRYGSDRKECLIVDSPRSRIALHGSSYAACRENEKRHFVEGDIILHGDKVVESFRKDLEKLSCSVSGVHEHHFNERHAHLFCEADEEKIRKVFNYLKWF